jgi:small subunit ribosomal protein S3
MGKKVNPNSFRSGIFNNYNSNWFNFNLNNYSNLINEDYIIRNLIGTFFKSKFFILDIPIINRNLNGELEIIINYFNIVKIEKNKLKQKLKLKKLYLVKKIKNYLNNKIRNYKKLFIKFYQVKSLDNSAKLINLIIFKKLDKKIPLKRIIKELINFVFNQSKIKGIKIKISGRLLGEEKSNITYEKMGVLSLQTICKDVKYSFDLYSTTYGSVGFKLWISF